MAFPNEHTLLQGHHLQRCNPRCLPPVQSRRIVLWRTVHTGDAVTTVSCIRASIRIAKLLRTSMCGASANPSTPKPPLAVHSDGWVYEQCHYTAGCRKPPVVRIRACIHPHSPYFDSSRVYQSALFTPLGEYQAQPLGYNAGDTILVPPIYTTSSAYSSASFCPHLMTLYSPSQQTTPHTASSAEGSYRVSQCYISSCMSFAIPGTPGQQHLFEPVSERLHSLVTRQGSGVSRRGRSDQLNSLEAETQYRNGIPSGSMPLDERWSRQMPSEFEQRGDWSRSVPPHITVQCRYPNYPYRAPRRALLDTLCFSLSSLVS